MDGPAVVTGGSGRGPYTGGSAGAPPVPPPGGYRAAQRIAPPPAAAPAPAEAEPAPRPTVASWIALLGTIALGFVLLILWAAGSPGAIYGVAMLVLQLVVVVAIVAALVDPRGRRLGSAALVIALVLNVGTIGAASALTHPPAPPGSVASDPEDDYWAAYPGIRGWSSSEILARPSLEEVQREADRMLAAVRARLARDFGVEWVRGLPGYLRHERNGYGGESMLVEFGSGNWATTTPVTDYATKIAMMTAIEDVLVGEDFWGMFAFNEPSSGFDDAYLERLYGGTDPRTQPEWEWYTDNSPGPIRFYAMITDLTHDDSGAFRRAREARVAGTAEPVEGLRIMVIVPELLSEDDVEEFLERMADYPF